KRVADHRIGKSDDAATRLFESDGDLFLVRIGSTSGPTTGPTNEPVERATRLTFTTEAERVAALSPDGRFVSFVRGHDLYLIETDGGRERAITRDGEGET